jgi:hypothetical protein
MKPIKLVILVIGLLVFCQVARAQLVLNPRITWNSGTSQNPDLVSAPSGPLHVVWQDDTPGNYEIFYKKSTDNGITWTANQRLTYTANESWAPDLAVDSSGYLYLVWHEYMQGQSDIYFKKSMNGGANWTATKRLTWTSSWSLEPSITVDSLGHLHVVWSDFTPGNYEIYYMKSTDGGASWTTGKRLTWNAGWSQSPKIVAYSSNYLHVVWSDSTPGVNEIYYMRSTDGGTHWSASQRLTWTSGWSYAPDLAVDLLGHPHVVWYDNTPGNNEIYYVRSPDGGASWTTRHRLTWTSGDSLSPSLFVDSEGYLNLVWSDNSPGNYEIYFKRSVDWGNSWSTNLRRTWNSGESNCPVIVIDSLGRIHVAWYDNTPANYEIYCLSWEFLVPILSSFGVP